MSSENAISMCKSKQGIEQFNGQQMSLAWLKQKYRLLGKVGSNTLWLSIEQICAALSGMILTIVAARLYGPETLGDLAFAMGFVGLFLPIVTFGLQPIVVREIAKKSHPDSEIISASLYVNLTISIFAIVLIGLLITVATDRSRVQILAIILGLRVFLSSASIMSAWYQAHLKSYLFAKIRIAGLIIGSVLYMLCVILELSIYALVGAVTLEALLVTIMALTISFGKSTDLKLTKTSSEFVKQLLRHATPIAISGVAVTIYHRSDQVMLGMMSTQLETGLYAVSSRLYGAVILIPSALAASSYPILVRQIKNSCDSGFKPSYQWFFDSTVASAMVLAAFMFFAAPLIIFILFGSEFSNSVPILQIHAVSAVFVAVGMARNRYLYCANLQTIAMTATIFGAFVNVALNLVLIPRYGGVGAATATLIAQFIIGYAFCLSRSDLHPLFRALSLALLVPVRLLSPRARANLLARRRTKS